jgi:ribonuclease M5
MTGDVILESLRRAGATIEGDEVLTANQITKQDLMALGLSGGPDASARRLKLLKELRLPERMSPNAMLQALNLLYTLEELTTIVDAME